MEKLTLPSVTTHPLFLAVYRAFRECGWTAARALYLAHRISRGEGRWDVACSVADECGVDLRGAIIKLICDQGSMGAWEIEGVWPRPSARLPSAPAAE